MKRGRKFRPPFVRDDAADGTKVIITPFELHLVSAFKMPLYYFTRTKILYSGNSIINLQCNGR